MRKRQYIAIDLKSFYASVECVERGLDPLDACLLVADASRTTKTICLAVSAALKNFGLPGRPRLFEASRRICIVNRSRGHAGKSISGRELAANPDLAVDYIVATPRMQLYVDYSNRIYAIYMRYIAPEDIHVYSIDEVFIDATAYLDTYGISARELAMRMIRDILTETGITATAGIGSNLYLCKIAMDIEAKKMPPDKDGVRIAELDEMSYRRKLWTHTPLTDFWHVGGGTARRLASVGIYTMGDIARCSVNNEEKLYGLFGVNAELLIDHAWGWEPVTIAEIKAYRPATHSMSKGQVLSSPYPFVKARTVIQEMADSITLELVDQGLVTDKIVLTVNYDAETLSNPANRALYHGRISTDHYGRPVPYHAHGTFGFERPTASSRLIIEGVTELFERIVDPRLLIRRLTLSVDNLTPEAAIRHRPQPVQLELFTDYEELERQKQAENAAIAKERRRQEAIIRLRKRFGKNAILRGLNYKDGATQRERNKQIGGHKA